MILKIPQLGNHHLSKEYKNAKEKMHNFVVYLELKDKKINYKEL
jgi:hypothetical protein